MTQFLQFIMQQSPLTPHPRPISIMSTPAPFDLATLNAHLRQRIEVLCPAESDRQLLHQRLAHIAKDEPYTIRPSTRPLAELIDHTILKADARLVDVQQLCADALAHRFATVCVNGSRVPAAVEYLNAHAASSVSPPTVTAVIGFPLGSMDSRSKAFECQSVLLSGARDVDMVINVGLVKDGNFQAVREDIQAVYNEVVKANQEQAPDRPKKILKVILETSLLTELEIIDVTLLCAIVGVQFVKTCKFEIKRKKKTRQAVVRAFAIAFDLTHFRSA